MSNQCYLDSPFDFPSLMINNQTCSEFAVRTIDIAFFSDRILLPSWHLSECHWPYLFCLGLLLVIIVLIVPLLNLCECTVLFLGPSFLPGWILFRPVLILVETNRILPFKFWFIDGATLTSFSKLAVRSSLTPQPHFAGSLTCLQLLLC